MSACPASAASTSESPPILRLPPELLDYLLSHVPPHQLQRTALSLHQVFPAYPFSKRHLFRHVIVHRPQQLKPLWIRLKEEKDKERSSRRGTAGDSDGDESRAGEQGIASSSIRSELSQESGLHHSVKTVAVQSWKGDADLLNNALRLVDRMDTLMLHIGTNFAPEHLEEMFEDPRPGMKRMEMRFRPYTEHATYIQFLKGSYFDTAIESLTRHWPEVESFTHLSIVQDPPPRLTAPPTAMQSLLPSAVHSTVPSPRDSGVNSLASSIADIRLEASTLVAAASGAPTPDTSDDEDDRASDTSTAPTSTSSGDGQKGYTGHGPIPYLPESMEHLRPKTFAQPIVFFDIKCLAHFGASPVARNLTHLRLRVPSRDLARILIGPAGAFGRHKDLFPALRYLDISTTNLRLDNTFSTLLRCHSRLEHLVLDRVNLFGFAAREKGAELCRDLGGLIVSASLLRGKERERQVAAWEVAQRTREAQAELEARRALAGPTHAGENPNAASLAAMQAEEDERAQALALARSRRGHRSAAMSTFSIRDRPARSSRLTDPSSPFATGAGHASAPLVLPPQDKLYLVLPPLPSLRSISIGGEAQNVPSSRTKEWDEEFQSGWRDGLAKLNGWAVHVAEKYERALKKADEWKRAEVRVAGTGMSSGSTGKAKGKSKAALPASAGSGASGASTSASSSSRVKPPLDVRLFRFPLPREHVEEKEDALNPLAGLVELAPAGRDYLTVYKEAIHDAELWTYNHAVVPPCVMCTVPDCEGPARRGDEGARLDGRGGMSGRHKEGCGHLYGRKEFGWEAVEP